MVSLLSTKFHEILFSSFRGVALTNCVTDRRTGQKQYVSPPKWGRHKYSKQSYVYQVMILKKTVNKNHPQTNILGQFIINMLPDSY